MKNARGMPVFNLWGREKDMSQSSPPPAHSSGHQKDFATTLETLNMHLPPGVHYAAEMLLYNHSILEHGFLSTQRSNKWRQDAAAKNKIPS